MAERSPEYAGEMVRRYALACTESRADDVAELFAEDAELRDPFDGQAVKGREAIREFFRGGVGLIDLLEVAGPVRVTADAAVAAAPMFAEVTLDGTALSMDTIDVFFFDEDGLFGAMHAFYGPSNVRPREQ
ncbi:MAG TPA: nuclear transport factor 2 family protein [Acidimicrobiales bacterium]|nr:nuclear transport factor 2 family protein [Acidimicrobiales bacterium]